MAQRSGMQRMAYEAQSLEKSDLKSCTSLRTGTRTISGLEILRRFLRIASGSWGFFVWR